MSKFTSSLFAATAYFIVYSHNPQSLSMGGDVVTASLHCSRSFSLELLTAKLFNVTSIIVMAIVTTSLHCHLFVRYELI
jgi:hypothetical protein